MEVPAVFVIIGAVFLLVGVLGGGLEVKEIRIPTIDKTVRYISVALGVLFVVGGLVLHGLPREGRITQPAPPHPPSPLPSPLPHTPNTPGSIAPAPVEPVQPLRQGADSVVAEATHKYWEKALKIDRYREDKREEVNAKYKNRQDTMSEAEKLDQLASILVEVTERERALPIQNVDAELIQVFANGRHLLRQMASLFRHQALALRETASLSGPLPHVIQMDIDRLLARQDALFDEIQKHDQEWELLRIRLIQRYNKHFPAH